MFAHPYIFLVPLSCVCLWCVRDVRVGVVLSCDVLCCGVLCCTVLRCAVLCCAMFCCAERFCAAFVLCLAELVCSEL